MKYPKMPREQMGCEYNGPRATDPYFDPRFLTHGYYILRGIGGLQPGKHKEIRKGQDSPVLALLHDIEDVMPGCTVARATLCAAFKRADLDGFFGRYGSIVAIAHSSKGKPYAAITPPGHTLRS